MGLSGRKVKQKIGNDPRNLSWADDAARFGSNYLSKFGWDSSKGLGVSGEGRTRHIKVAHKLDMMGIGAAHSKDPNGIAWKQNKDYENLLKRLNEANAVEEEEQAGIVVDGFVKSKGNIDENVGSGEEQNMTREQKKEKKAKRKKEKENADKDKEKKKKRKRDDNVEGTGTEPMESKPTSSEPTHSHSHSTEQKTPRAIPRHRLHRARHIAAKSLGSQSATAISEILGIPPSRSLASSATSFDIQTPQEGKLTSIYDNNDDTPHIDKITTSTKSLQDYFKEKMGNVKGLASSFAAARSSSGTSGAGYDDYPRAGLGSRPELAMDEDDAPRIGLSNVSALVSPSVMTATSLTSMVNTEDTVLEDDWLAGGERDEEERRQRKKERKVLREERKRRKLGVRD